MKHTKEVPFTFEKIDGKWKSKLNPKWFFFMYSTYGFPLELSLEEIEKWSLTERLVAIGKSWEVFAKKNKIDTKVFKKDFQDNEEQYIKLFSDLLKKK